MEVRELYPLSEHEKSSVFAVEDEEGNVCVRKTLSVYSLSVFACLRDHPDPHIPKIYHFSESGGILTVYEELIYGETLDFYLRRGGMKKKEKKRILLEICDGLIFLHAAKPAPIIHRDLKSTNVMIADDGRVVLIDYDAARIYTPGKEQDTRLIGTEGSAAPEQYGFGQSDARTDVYALGVLMKRMFPEDERMLRIAEKATRLDPKDRFASASEVKACLLKGDLPEESVRDYFGLFMAGEILKGREKRDKKDQKRSGGFLKILPEKLKARRGLLMREEDLSSACFCTNCGACLDSQAGFSENDGTWTCAVCGQFLFGEEAGDTGDRMNGVIWYCDFCGAILNKQEGFDYYDDTWTCTSCGGLNDITAENIRPETYRK